jgi:transposase-like protein
MEQIAWPNTLIEAVRYFSNLDRALVLLVAIRWPDGVSCPTCGTKKVSFLKTRWLWKCSEKHARRQFSIKVGSIFEDSPLPLDKWLVAMWLIVNCKNGISSYEVARDLKVTQQTAWFMLHRIRKAMQRGTFEKMGGSGPVEADETFIGGLARNMHKDKKAEKIHGTGGVGKELVVGLLDRETGKVRVTHIENRKRSTLQAHVREHVASGAELYTDELASYTGLDKDYVHQFVNHAEEYVRGNVHTNGIDISGRCSSAASREPMSASNLSISSATLTNKLSDTMSARMMMVAGLSKLQAPHSDGGSLTKH